jgi:hypothetical protein
MNSDAEEQLQALGMIIWPVGIPLGVASEIGFTYIWTRDYLIGREADFLLLSVTLLFLLFLPILSYRQLRNKYGWFDSATNKNAKKQIFGIGALTCALSLFFINHIHRSDVRLNIILPKSMTHAFVLPLALILIYCLIRFTLAFRRNIAGDTE